jgi:hypothetical protein
MTVSVFMLLSEGQAGEAWEPSNKAIFFLKTQIRIFFTFHPIQMANN